MDLDTNNHSVFKLNYHLILVVKYRKKVIDDAISNRLKQIFEDICLNYHITLKEWNHDIDHVHVLLTAKPNTELSKFINAYKSASSRRIKNEFPNMRQQLWKQYFWSQSYCLLTVGGAPLEVVKKYIESQGQKEVR
ncbi:IS200/IS605 family transposase [Caryophanon tenue]|uniref:Transposase n=1 Tax=Caryophanon tenue TaxID=33978 RepID=A0A1C0Y6R3_9BACL|nr:IS200/IS605 family transposase [Caryophanon tenue]OCS82841.1 transposase [Caryophanon tenue]